MSECGAKHPRLGLTCGLAYGHDGPWHKNGDCLRWWSGEGESTMNECGARHPRLDITCEVYAGHSSRWHERGFSRWTTGGAEVCGQCDSQGCTGACTEKAADQGPDYYTSPEQCMQVWDVIDAFGLDYYAGNVLKYVIRAGKKGPAGPDLRKAAHFLERMIERLGDDQRSEA